MRSSSMPPRSSQGLTVESKQEASWLDISIINLDQQDMKPVMLDLQSGIATDKGTVDKMHFKAVARQKFDAVLKHEINNRRMSTDSSFNAPVNEGLPQHYRIENAKVINIQEIAPKVNHAHNSVVSQNAPVVSKEFKIHMGPDIESIKNSYSVLKTNRDVDGHVFIYDSVLISSDTLDYIGCEKNSVNSSTSKQNTKPDDVFPHAYPENVPMYRCLLCPYFHVKEMMIARHWIQSHLSNNVYLCPYCHSEFLTNHLVSKHIVEYHNDKHVEIQIKKSNQFAVILSFDQSNNSSVGKLEKSSNDEKEKSVFSRTSANVPVKCHKCNLQCKSIYDLEEHHKHIHIHFRPYSCGLCNSKVCFTTKDDLEHHTRITHPNSLSKQKSDLKPQTNSDSTNEVNLCIDWSQTCVLNQKGKVLKCKWCSFRTLLGKDMCQHALKVHPWSKVVNCPKCNALHELKDECYKDGTFICSICSTQVKISHNLKINNVSMGTTTIFKCKTCPYSTSSRGGICRHLKYSHAKCRPFCCPYCSYAAVERPKVRSHIMSIHPGKELQTVEKVEKNAAFKKMIGHLFDRFVAVERVDTFKNAFSGAITTSESGELADPQQATLYECGACEFVSESQEATRSHASLCHKDDIIQLVIREPNIFPTPFGEHYKCLSCYYKCSDRSCMARHVKYKHLTSRPHYCPYCKYNNVEKTKVRLHVRSNHNERPKIVKTNYSLLEQMTLEAKKFYVRVDANGRQYQERNVAVDVNAVKNDSKQLIIRPYISTSEVKTEPIEAGNIPTNLFTPVRNYPGFEDVNAKNNSSQADCSSNVKEEAFCEMTLDNSSNRDEDALETSSGSLSALEDEDMVDLNYDSIGMSDEDFESCEDYGEPSCKKFLLGIKKIDLGNYHVDELASGDPKITKLVPVVELEDIVRQNEDSDDDDILNLLADA